jgi:hypothetical protein
MNDRHPESCKGILGLCYRIPSQDPAQVVSIGALHLIRIGFDQAPFAGHDDEDGGQPRAGR